MRRTFWLLFLLLTGDAASTEAARILGQTPQGGFPSHTLGGTDWTTFTSMMTAFHSVFQIPNFTSLPLMLNYDAVWVDQELGNTLSGAEVSNLQDYIASGHRAVLIGENLAWSAWNASLLSVVGGSHTDDCSFAFGTPTSSHSLTAGVTMVQNACGSILGPAGFPDVLFSNNFAALYSLGAGEALVIMDSNWNDNSFIRSVENETFAANVVNWLGGTSTPAAPEPGVMLLFGSGLVLLVRRRARIRSR
jgi:hypothetical protein